MARLRFRRWDRGEGRGPKRKPYSFQSFVLS